LCVPLNSTKSVLFILSVVSQSGKPALRKLWAKKKDFKIRLLLVL
jgi:hypothetical protein